MAALAFLRAPVAVEPTRRLAISIPERSVLTHFALSPDGKRLALTLVRDDARAQIWLRPLDSTEFHALPGTFGARAPFWSPDGRSIGFFAEGKLKIVSANGGPPQDLCDGTGLGAGGAWNRDGVIVIAAFRPGAPMRRVNASGGPCTDLNVGDGLVGYPHFLPDGRHFLYVVGGPDSAKRGGLYVADLEDPTGRRLLADVSSAVYSPSSADVFSGHLLFLRDNNLMAVPFDARELQVVGDAFTVTSQASTSFSAPQVAADVSADGLLAYLANRAETTRFAWIEGGKEIATVGSAGVQQNVQLSPNGQALAFTRDTHNWLRDLTRSVETRLIDDHRTAVVWSPDSQFVSYGRALTGLLVTRHLTTGKEDSITFDTYASRTPSDWSRDGTVLLYTEVNPTTQSDIWALIDPRNTSNRRRAVPFVVTAAGESQAQMSPDGRWVAYASDESGIWALYVKGFPDGAVKRISPAQGREPRWSADGRELYYLSGLSGRQTLNAVAIDGSASDLRVGDIQQLFEFRGRPYVQQSNIFQYAAARDRRRFLVNVLTSDAEPTLNVITNWQAAAR
jgi:Tol biopolymer transport system component